VILGCPAAPTPTLKSISTTIFTLNELQNALYGDSPSLPVLSELSISPPETGHRMPEKKPLHFSTPGLTFDSANWRTVAEKAAQETDPDKLLELVHHLCRILDEHESFRTR